MTQNCSTWTEASRAAANYGNAQIASGNFDIGQLRCESNFLKV